jgi:UDPglucose 6-dehydrogenase
MRVTVVGVGYVGLVAAACMADGGNHVICVDTDEKKINDSERDYSHLEPDWPRLLPRNEKSAV